MTVKPGSKYYPLFQYLRSQNRDRVLLTFDQIEKMLKEPLPESARKRIGFWSNRDQGGYQAGAWMEAGFRVARVDLGEEEIEFKRAKLRYQVKRSGGSFDWDREAVQALRAYLGLSQAEMAERLGVRQQTISEWETGQYQPTRGRSKFLTMVAERAGFPFQAKGTDKAKDIDKVTDTDKAKD